MKLLAIDTSTNRFSVAVCDEAKILAGKNIIFTKVLENSIIPVIDETLKKVKVPFNRLDGFAVGLGPGSFQPSRRAFDNQGLLSGDRQARRRDSEP